MRLRFIDWKYVWLKYRFYLLGGVIGAALFFLLSCSLMPQTTPAEGKPGPVKLQDPLDLDHKQKQSVTMYLKKYGQPVLYWSYSDDDLKFEVFQWKAADPERWAIRINGVYKFTWTQLKTIKEEK